MPGIGHSGIPANDLAGAFTAPASRLLESEITNTICGMAYNVNLRAIEMTLMIVCRICRLAN
jgi:hypothetical protein